MTLNRMAKPNPRPVRHTECSGPRETLNSPASSEKKTRIRGHLDSLEKTGETSFMATTLYQSDIPYLKLLFRGKVRDIYDLGDELLLVATDRLSAFDVVFPNPIPGKGEILTQVSLFWFNKMKSIIPNHISDKPVEALFKTLEEVKLYGKRSMRVKKTKPLAIAAVMRGYLAGAGWKDYQRTGEVCGIALPPGLKESQKLPEPIFTPATKAPQGEHDE